MPASNLAVVAALALHSSLLLADSVQTPVTSVEYRLEGKLVFVPVSINGSAPEWFCLDSATAHTIIDPRLSARLKLQNVASATTTGSGTGDVPVVRVKALTMKVGALQMTIPDPWVVDLKDVPIPQDVRGVVGSELFRQYVVRLDPERHSLDIFDPGSFKHASNGATLPLIEQGGKLFMDVKLDVKPGLTVTHRVEISTGSEESVNDPIVREAVTTQKSVLGNGLGENFEGWSGLMDAVHIGPYTITRVWGPGGPNPSIGMEMLRRFVVTFDMPNGKIHLLPTRALTEPVPPPPT